MHELLRQFGAEKLAASGDRQAIQAQHTAFFADFMAERKQDICTNRQLEAVELIDPDFENVRSAWLHVVNQQEWEQLPKFLYSLWFYVDVRTRGQEGIELLEQAIETLQSATPSAEIDLARGRILARLCWFYNDQGFREKTLATSNEALHILQQHGGPDDLMAALYSHALVTGFLERFEATSVSSQEGLGIARLQGDKNWEGLFLIWLGLSHFEINDLEAALRLAEEALAIFQASGNRWGLQHTHSLIGEV
jgi:tetratricopeptide (TPR) repeat protein